MKKKLGLIVFLVINLFVFFRGWETQVGMFEWPVIGLCLNMEGVVILGFSKRLQDYWLFPVNPTGWTLMFLGFFLQLFWSPFSRFV